jgi:hypothetical protein
LADELDEESSVVTQCLDQDHFMVNGVRMERKAFADHIPVGFFNAGDVPAPASQKEDPVMDLDQLKSEYPQLVEELRAESVAAGRADERARIEAIEEIATAGYADMVHDAKFVNPISAENLAVKILREEKRKAAAFAKDQKADSDAAFQGMQAPEAPQMIQTQQAVAPNVIDAMSQAFKRSKKE